MSELLSTPMNMLTGEQWLTLAFMVGFSAWIGWQFGECRGYGRGIKWASTFYRGEQE